MGFSSEFSIQSNFELVASQSFQAVPVTVLQFFDSKWMEKREQTKGYSRVFGRAKKRKNNSPFLAERGTEFASASA